MSSLQDIGAWLNDESPDALETLATRAERLTRQRFGHTIQLFAPLYLSNECVDTCSYCGFSRTNQIPRRTLSVAEVQAEASFLAKEGFRHLLLVAGEHPKAVSVAYLQNIAQALRAQFASLSIEVAPFEQNDYASICLAGIDGVVIYQETYDRARYAAVHIAGPKRHYDQRLAAPERAAQGGARRLGMGILLGLADWRQDALSLIDHVKFLQKKYWQLEFTVSLPRLRPCTGGLPDPYLISDQDFVKLVCILRLALPEVGLVLSTREPVWLRDGLMRLGVTHMSAASKTAPGAYLDGDSSGQQFQISDERSVPEVIAAIRAQRLEPVWKDWENSLHA